MTDAASAHRGPLSLKYLTSAQVRAHLSQDPRLIVPVGTTQLHGPHLPLGCDTIIVERLADDLSTEFAVLRAPAIEYGVNARAEEPFPGSAGLRRKTLHRFMNDLVGAWEAGGVREFIVLTAHGQEPHREALSTLHTRTATVRSVDMFAVPHQALESNDRPDHGGIVDTSLLLYLDHTLVGAFGRPLQASADEGDRLYHLILDRVATRVFRRDAA